jgi:hypothetical protein
VRVDKGLAVSPQVCHFGGPTGLNADRLNDPAVLNFYGQAENVSAVLPARSGITLNTRGEDYVYAQAPIDLGDSGGPWLTEDGRAIGYLTHILGYGPQPSTDVGIALVRRLGPQVQRAEKELGIDLKLVTAPVLP